MRVRANLFGEGLIRDYLSRVADAAARYLPKDRRAAFVGRIRNLIEWECGPAGEAGMARIREVLAGLGDPVDLVMAERARLDAESIKRQSRHGAAGDAGAAEATAPQRFRPRGAQASRGSAPRSPAGADGPAPGGTAGPAQGGADGPAPGGTAGPAPGGAGETVLEGRVLGRGPSAGSGASPAGGAGTQAPGGRSTRGPGAGGRKPAQRQPVGRLTPAGAGARPAASTALSPGSTPGDGTSTLSHKLQDVAAMLGHGVARLAARTARLARRHPLETAAIVLLGVGGLIFPFPFWLLGGLLAVRSRVWDVGDKWIALAGPPAFALVGTVITALIIGGWGHAVTMYPHAFRLDFGYLLRVGSVLCAGYLVLQLRHGPKKQLPPWKR